MSILWGEKCCDVILTLFCFVFSSWQIKISRFECLNAAKPAQKQLLTPFPVSLEVFISPGAFPSYTEELSHLDNLEN